MREQVKSSRRYEKITISFTEADGDIVEFVKELKMSNKASEFIREAIREKIEGRPSKNSDINNAEVLDLKERMSKIEQSLISLTLTPINARDEDIKDNYIVESKKEENKEEGKEDEIGKIDDDLLNALDSFEL